MPQTISGSLAGAGISVALVVARFNDFITSRLAGGAVEALVRHGVAADQITQVSVPGAWEVPLVARRLAESGRFAAVVCLGCVIRGQTPHFDYVAGESAKGIAQAALATGVPIAFGVVTADTLEQGIDRAGGKHGNKGAEAALVALEMANLMKSLGRLGSSQTGT